MSKNYFGIHDTRNTKYQGSINSRTYSGLGVLIDNLFLTIVSKWNMGSMQGPTFIIFPYMEQFYGNISADNQPTGICCFQLTNEKEKIVFEVKEGTQGNFEDSKITIALVMEGSSIAHLEKCRKSSFIRNSSDQPQSEKAQSIQDLFQVIGTYSLKSGTPGSKQELQYLSKIFKKEVTREQTQLKDFLRASYVDQSEMFQICGNKQSFFGFKNTQSLGFKFQNNSITSIGNFAQFPRNIVYGRKIIKKTFPKIQIQEGNYANKSGKIFTFPMNSPPIQAQRYTEQYFKRSTTFINEFTRLQKPDMLYVWLKNLQKRIQNQITQKFGQVLLQNSNPQGQQLPTKQYTLSQIRQQLNQKVMKRQGTNRTLAQDGPLSANKKHSQSEFLYDEDPLLAKRNSYKFNGRNIDQVNQFTILEAERNYENERYQQLLLEKEAAQNTAYLNEYYPLKNATQRLHINKQELAAKLSAELEMQRLHEEVALKELISEEQLKRQIVKVHLQSSTPLSNRYKKVYPDKFSAHNEAWKQSQNVARSRNHIYFPHQLQGAPTVAKTNINNKENTNDKQTTPFDRLDRTAQPSSSYKYTKNQPQPYPTIQLRNRSPYRQKVTEPERRNADNKRSSPTNKYTYLGEGRHNNYGNDLMPEIKLFDVNGQQGNEYGNDYDHDDRRQTGGRARSRSKSSNEKYIPGGNGNKQYTQHQNQLNGRTATNRSARGVIDNRQHRRQYDGTPQKTKRYFNYVD